MVINATVSHQPALFGPCSILVPKPFRLSSPSRRIVLRPRRLRDDTRAMGTRMPLQWTPRSSSLSLSFSAVVLHVVLGLPRLRRPSGAHVIAVLQSLSYPFLLCSMNFHLVLLTSSLRFPISAISSTSLLVILSWQHTGLNICLRHLFWTDRSYFRHFCSSSMHSQPYIKTSLTSVLYSLILIHGLMLSVL